MKKIRRYVYLAIVVLVIIAAMTACSPRNETVNRGYGLTEFEASATQEYVAETEASSEVESEVIPIASNTVEKSVNETETEKEKTDIERIEEIIGQKFMKTKIYPSYVQMDVDKDGDLEYIVTYYDTNEVFTVRTFRENTLEEIPLNFEIEDLNSYVEYAGEISRTNGSSERDTVMIELKDKYGNIIVEKTIFKSNLSIDGISFDSDGTYKPVHRDREMDSLYLSKYIYITGVDYYCSVCPLQIYLEYDDKSDSMVLSDDYRIGDYEHISFDDRVDFTQLLDENIEVYYDDFKVWEKNSFHCIGNEECIPCEVVIDGIRKMALSYNEIFIIKYRNSGFYNRYIIKRGSDIGFVTCEGSLWTGTGWSRIYLQDVTGDGVDELLFTGNYSGTNCNEAYVDVVNLDTIEKIPINYDFDTIADYVEGSGSFADQEWTLYSGSYDAVECNEGRLSVYTLISKKNPKYVTGEFIGKIKAYFSYMPETNSFEISEYEITTSN